MSNVAVNNDTCTHGFIQASCTNCNLKGLCLPLAMDIKDIDRLNTSIARAINFLLFMLSVQVLSKHT
jgi:hypothetical protein